VFFFPRSHLTSRLGLEAGFNNLGFFLEKNESQGQISSNNSSPPLIKSLRNDLQTEYKKRPDSLHKLVLHCLAGLYHLLFILFRSQGKVFSSCTVAGIISA